ncbi:MAG: laccase domain-containing protein [Proteobacteria bacterium]|nr:laccase domain-containing protein [Pseudomonadota bacterium]NDC23505.1 laccase domain-containing protein [Pseudomonadota bacterium]NDD03658.1 laccase domain-containing protein [Pseudomonadota bacterium]NDG26099.1 laccase domain-containing protein [Pseudomonadota bacterium]
MNGSYLHVQWGFQCEKKGESLPLLNQVHGNTLIGVNAEQDINTLRNAPPDGDGVYAAFNGAELSVFSADCYPVLFFTEDPKGPIAAVHAGWRGIKAGIVGKTYHLLRPWGRLHAVIGPAIQSCCFTVREDFIAEWAQAGLEPNQFCELRSGKTHFDLLSFVLERELRGLSPQSIHLDNHRCTCCSLPPLPSFRRNKSANPRIRSWIRKIA